MKSTFILSLDYSTRGSNRIGTNVGDEDRQDEEKQQ